MITRSTVFVLGAGASHPYGFFTGAGLADSILETLENPGLGKYPRFGELLRAYVPNHLVDSFAETFRRARRDSLDAFVDSRREFRDLVKLAMTISLSAHEEDVRLVRADRKEDWCRYLLNRIVPGSAEGFLDNDLKVITFNFDRSFERSVCLALEANFNLDATQAAELASHIPVLHVHGQLGIPAWADSRDQAPDPSRRHYLHVLRDGELQACAAQIRIIHEEVEKSPELAQAREWLREAEVIAFLGFGFHPLNLERLSVGELRGNQLVRATALGFTNAELAPVRRAFTQTKIHLYPDFNCLDLLRNSEIIHG
jgi:hypothetical protein